MDGRNGKLAITAALVGLIIAASIAVTWGHDTPRPRSEGPPIATRPDANKLDAELQRCNQLGPNDKPDQACLDAWAEARRHFLGGQ